MSTFLYFAYGSNMSERRLTVQKRAPSAKVIGPAVLKNYCLTFHKCSSDGSGKCTIEKSESDKVYGVVFKIKLKDECQLDKEEGARGNGGYKKVTFKIEMCDATGSKYKDVKTYIANKDYINCTLKPYTWYKQHVLVGAIENKLPSSGSTAVKCGRRQMSRIMVEIGSHTKKCHTSVMRSKPCVD